MHRDVPVRNLRFAFAHANELDAEHIARMKDLGMYAAVHPWAVTGRMAGGRRVLSETIDRDYLSVPAEEIRDIRPVMTIVGERIVHEAAR